MSETWRSLRLLLPALTTTLALVAGCATVDDTKPTVEDTTPTEGTKVGIERWKCGDYFDGCGFLATDCVTLTANLHDGTGEVQFGEIVEYTRFEVHGIERRWDWCLNAEFAYDCAFVISIDGKGRYFNFRSSDDGRATPTDLFKCAKR